MNMLNITGWNIPSWKNKILEELSNQQLDSFQIAQFVREWLDNEGIRRTGQPSFRDIDEYLKDMASEGDIESVRVDNAVFYKS